MTSREEHYKQDEGSDSDSRIKVIYVDIKSLKFVNPLLQEILPSAILNKYTPHFQRNFSTELMDKVEDELKLTLRHLIFSTCNMLLHKVCPCEEEKKEVTLQMHIRALELFDNFKDIFREKRLQDAYFKLLELHHHISNIPDTPRFCTKLEEMMDEIITAINANENKEIFCFDVTEMFLLEVPKVREEEVKIKYCRNPQIRANDKFEPKGEDLQQEQAEKRDSLDWIMEGICAFFLISWQTVREHIFPPIIAVSQLIGIKIWKKAKSKFCQKAKKLKRRCCSWVESWRDSYQVDPLTQLYWLKYKASEILGSVYEKCISFEPQKKIKSIPWGVIEILFIPSLIIFSVVSITYFLHKKEPQYTQNWRKDPTYEEDYRRYSCEQMQDYSSDIRELKDREAKHFKDLKFVKAELEWLENRVQQNYQAQEVLSPSDLYDLRESVDKALLKYPNFR